ncbi:MAG TPA: phosphotransferase, partial [bacterium]|nr:phosphotransferase [bacterium]
YIYKKIIDRLIVMQTECGPALIKKYPERKFDASVYKWETEYFRTMVLDKYLSADYDKLELTKCFNHIAEYLWKPECLKPEKTLNKNGFFIHRDFQSQNILYSEKKIYFIDYQTAYYGSNFYDLASLLYDPYSENEIKIYFGELYNYYKNKFIEKFELFGSEEFDRRFALTSLQRLMQANAAYVKLGLIENKLFFKQFIDSALGKIYNILMKTDFSAASGADYLKSLFSKLEKEGKIKCAE